MGITIQNSNNIPICDKYVYEENKDSYGILENRLNWCLIVKVCNVDIITLKPTFENKFFKWFIFVFIYLNISVNLMVCIY